jgi:hypothetical protein
VLQLVLVFVQLKKGAVALELVAEGAAALAVGAEAPSSLELEALQLLSFLIPKTNHAQL